MKYGFEEFTLDLEASRLAGPDGEVRLRPQAFRMLEVLVESAPKILSQEELLDQVWGVEHLSPASVKQAISEVRQALGDDPMRPRIIETVHRRGYRFIAPVERLETDPPAPPQRSTAPLEPIPLLLLPTPPPKEELSTRPMAMDAVLAKIENAAQGRSSSRTPAARGRRRTFTLLVSLLAGLSVVSLLEESLPRGAARREVAVAPVHAASTSSRPAVAILGFRNLSAHPEDAWISAALGEILGFELAAPGKLRLIPADNVVRMQHELDVREDTVAPASLARIGRNLGTNLVVTGSYLVSPAEGGPKVRIQVLVQDVRTGETVAWARQTGTSAELLELATAAARGLLGSLGRLGKAPGGSSAEAAALAANGESLRLWSEAMSLLRVRDATAAIPLLQKAQSTDPDNPFVYDALSVAWTRLGFDARAADAAARALELSQGLSEEVRLSLAARAHETRFELAESARLYGELWRLFSDNLDYGLSLAAAQRRSGVPEASFPTVEALRKLPAPDGDDPRIDLAESDGAWAVGDFVRCRDAAQRAIEKARARDATLLVASGRVARGWAFKRLGQSDAAVADFQAAGAIYRRAGDRSAAASSRAAEALIYQSQGRLAVARQTYEEVITVFREVGDRTREAKALNNFAALVGEGDMAKTAELLERSLSIKREIEDQQGMALTLANLGNVYQTRGDTRGARPHLEEAIRISRRLGDAYGTAQALRGIARVESKEGRFAAGRAALEEALGLSRQNGDAEGLAQAELVWGDLEKKAGRPGEARRHYQASLNAFRRTGEKSYVIVVTIELANLDLAEGRLAEARTGYGQGLDQALALEDGNMEAHARFGLAQLAARQGDPAAARTGYEKALALWTEAKNREQAAEARAALAKLGAGRASAGA